MVSLFSSFGYFGEAGDREVLLEIGRVLRPGGDVVLDLLNPPRVRATLVPRTRRERGGLEVVETRTLADGGRTVRKEVRLRGPQRDERAWTEEVRMYESAEIAGLLSRCGLDLVEALGDFDGTPLSPSSPRQVLRARKP